jgi:hypothetical protein
VLSILDCPFGFLRVVQQRGTKEEKTQKKPKGQTKMDNPKKTKGAIKNGQPRENQRGNQEWTTQRKPKGQPRMDNPEKNQKGNQEWTTQRKPKGFVGNGQP